MMRDPVLRRAYFGAAAVLVSLLVAGLGSVLLVSRERDRAVEALRTGSWIAVQAEVESLRLLDALGAYETGAVADRQALLDRLDIFWSRIPLMLAGDESMAVAQVGHSGTAASILNELPGLETRIVAYRPGDGSYPALRGTVDSMRARLHEISVDVLGRRQYTGDVQRLVQSFSLITGWVLATLVSGSLLFGMLLRQLRRSSNLMHEAREAAAAAARAAEAAVEADRAKSRFLASASHDLRQPLNAALLLLGALRSRVAGREALPLLEKASFALGRLGEQLNAYLDMTKLDTAAIQPEIKPIPLAPVLASVTAGFAELASEKGLRLRVVASSAWVRTDAGLVERALTNLVSNAVRHTASGGVLVGCRRRGDGVRIDVIDSGPGIPEDKRDRIFEEFFQIGNAERSSDQGHGLGLAIVDRILRLLGHPLELETMPGKGSRFSVWLPAAAPEAGAGTAEAPPARRSQAVQVLVVEDDELIAESLALLISSLGHAAATAATAEDAIARVRDRAILPDLILADHRLPGRSGLEAVAEIRVLAGRSIPAAIVTGDTGPELKAATVAAGVVLMPKPVSPEQIARLLATAAQPQPAETRRVDRTACGPVS